MSLAHWEVWREHSHHTHTPTYAHSSTCTYAHRHSTHMLAQTHMHTYVYSCSHVSIHTHTPHICTMMPLQEGVEMCLPFFVGGAWQPEKEHCSTVRGKATHPTHVVYCFRLPEMGASRARAQILGSLKTVCAWGAGACPCSW